jgi:hypothetical protein
MDYKKLTLLFLFSAVLLTGCFGGTKLTVKVYWRSNTLSGAKVDLFNGNLTFIPEPHGCSYYLPDPQAKLLSTSYTDDSGIVVFDNLPLNESLYIVVSKEGYKNEMRQVNTLNTSIEVHLYNNSEQSCG